MLKLHTWYTYQSIQGEVIELRPANVTLRLKGGTVISVPRARFEKEAVALNVRRLRVSVDYYVTMFPGGDERVQPADIPKAPGWEFVPGTLREAQDEQA